MSLSNLCFSLIVICSRLKRGPGYVMNFFFYSVGRGWWCGDVYTHTHTYIKSLVYFMELFLNRSFSEIYEKGLIFVHALHHHQHHATDLHFVHLMHTDRCVLLTNGRAKNSTVKIFDQNYMRRGSTTFCLLA